MESVLEVPLPGLDECWALDNHWDHDLGERTRMGKLVYEAKYLKDVGAREALATEMTEGVRLLARMPESGVAGGQVIIGVPAVSGAEQLPTILAARIAAENGMRFERDRVSRIAHALKVKFAPNAAKQAVVSGAFTCRGSLAGTVVVVIDDMVQTGSTFGEVARVMRMAGASQVIGFAATKVDTGMTT